MLQTTDRRTGDDIWRTWTWHSSQNANLWTLPETA